MKHQPIITASSASITLAQAEAIRGYAKRRGCVQIQMAAAAVIDGLNGVPDFWRDLPQYEDDLFALIEDQRDSPDWYATLREAKACAAIAAGAPADWKRK